MTNVRRRFDRLNGQQKALVVLGAIVVAAVLLLLLVRCTQGSPDGSPRPTTSARPNTSAGTGATGRPTDGSATDQPSPGDPTPTPEPTDPPITPPPDMDPPTAELFLHIPNALRSTCQTGPFLEPVVATLYCTTDDGVIAVQYSSYPDADSMNAAYGASVELTEIDPGSGRCYVQTEDGTITAALGRWPAEQPYSVEGDEVGRYVCFEDNQPTIAWTDERFNILTVASGPADTVDRLVTFWVLRSGPYP